MITVAVAIATLLGQAQASASTSAVRTPPSLPSPDQAKRTVVACGLSEQQVTVRYESHMQEDVIWVEEPTTALTDSDLECIARASLDVNYYVYFHEEVSNRRYWATYGKVGAERSTAEARTWLADRGLLATMPRPRRDSPASEFATTVEHFCGLETGELLEGQGTNFITFATDRMEERLGATPPHRSVTEEQYTCVSHVMAATDLASYGLFFGFIGNPAEGPR